MSGSIRRLALPLIIAGYLVLGIAYSVVTPLGEAPDEVDHVRYLQLLARTENLPVMQPEAADNLTMEANQPPLYYLLGAGVWRLFVHEAGATDELLSFEFAPCFPLDPAVPGRKQFYLHTAAEAFPYSGEFAAFHAVRLLSLAMGAGAVWLAYRIGRQLAPRDGRVALLAAALLAFNPQFLFITASVNNDNLTVLLGAGIVFLASSLARQVTNRRIVFLGAVLGLGALTKLSLFALWPAAFLGLLIGCGAGRGTWRVTLRRFIPGAAVLALMPLLIAGWWYWRSQQLYGDPLTWAVHLQAKYDSIARLTPFTSSDLGEFITTHLLTYWATFGWLNIRLPAAVYWLLAAMLLAALAGVALLVSDWIRSRRGAPPEVSSSLAFDPVVMALNCVAVLGVYLSLLRYVQVINWSGYQGRLAYAVAASVAVLLAVGLWRLGGRALAWVAGGGLAILAVAGLGLLASEFARPLIYQPVAADSRPCVRMIDWQVEGVDISDKVMPGDSLAVVLYGFGLNDNEATPIKLELVGRDGQIVAQLDEQLAVLGGQPLSATLALPVVEGAQPARALLRIAAPTADGLLPLTNARGQSLETPFPLAWVKIAPASTVAEAPRHLSGARFGDQLVLQGYDEQHTADRALRLTLQWQALGEMTQDYAFFVHVLDGAGNQVGQWDGQPLEGAYPTSIWDAGEVVQDTIELQLPAGAAMLAIGVYAPETGLRLPVTSAAGERLPDDRLLIGIAP